MNEAFALAKVHFGKGALPVRRVARKLAMSELGHGRYRQTADGDDSSTPMSGRRCLRLFETRPEAVFPGMLALEAVNEHLVRLVRSIIVNERIERLKLADMADSMPIPG